MRLQQTPPLVLILLQAAILVFLPGIADRAGYLFMVAAPVCTAGALAWRGAMETGPARTAWWLIAASLLLWSAGSSINLWQEWILGNYDGMHRYAMLGFHLTAVPLIFLIGSEWRAAGRRAVTAIDAVLALALGYIFFLMVWATLTAQGAPDGASIATMIWLVDAQNLFIAIGALGRWRAAEEHAECDVFRALTFYSLLYLAVAFLNNHFIAGHADFGARESSVITATFALFWFFALDKRDAGSFRRPDPRFARAVRSASPIIIATTLLIVSLFLIRANYLFGAAGIVISLLGYGLRATVSQIGYMAHDEILQSERTELESIAWTDALTGIANRRFLDRALDSFWRSGLRARQPVAVLMIDVDHFKSLNDRLGHTAGDTCLREVAAALQKAMVRPEDLVGRYGGEEFMVLLKDADQAGALVVAERLRAAIERLQIQNPDSPLGALTVSIGTASTKPNAESDIVNLVRAADKALYAAKQAGRNQVCCLEPDGTRLAPLIGTD